MKRNEGEEMDSDAMKGKWKQAKGKAREQWGKLTDDDLDRVRGNYENLVGKVQEKYGKTKEESKKEVDSFLDKY